MSTQLAYTSHFYRAASICMHGGLSHERTERTELEPSFFKEPNRTRTFFYKLDKNPNRTELKQ